MNMNLWYQPGLTAQVEEDGSIIFCAQEETVFTIPAPFMYDASGAVSEAVQYNLQREGTGYRLTLTAQASWINDPSRSFPVVIDPDVTHWCGGQFDIDGGCQEWRKVLQRHPSRR